MRDSSIEVTEENYDASQEAKEQATEAIFESILISLHVHTHTVQKPETADGYRVFVKHRQSATTVTLSEDELKGFSSSKDGTIVHWDVDSGKAKK
ncbi:U3 snoRNP-associated protein-like YAO [Camellia lanceoleosa]|uniref:U3 snoRNP-associated protein-like YAO n=1 Tax=Camellia lanceoleosa TaxID=1840588 RepID=A0ACC0HMJ3_9ERIC|nr:U3 snoRNP-associated protein-like YAO [Camellia lanceoleosa]